MSFVHVRSVDICEFVLRSFGARSIAVCLRSARSSPWNLRVESRVSCPVALRLAFVRFVTLRLSATSVPYCRWRYTVSLLVFERNGANVAQSTDEVFEVHFLQSVLRSATPQ